MKLRASILVSLYALALILDALRARRPLAMADPFSTATLITLAITAATAAANYAYTYYSITRRKTKPSDVGRADDIRLQANGYGEFLTRIYGKARCAGILIDATEITHTTTTTPGQPGGKGAPKPPTPGEIRHVYTTTLAIAICEGLGDLGANLRVTRAWENTTLIYDTTVGDLGDALYEAEKAGNTLAGGAVEVSDGSASGGEAIDLPTNGSVQWNSVYGEGSGVVEFYYSSTAANTVEITLLTSEGPFTETLRNTNGEYVLYHTAPFPMLSGFTNTFKIKNTHASTLRVDYCIVRISTRGTGAVNPVVVQSPDDERRPLPFGGHFPQRDETTGETSGVLVAGGAAPFTIYTGTETQEPNSTLVALHGAANTPAYRGTCYVVFDTYQIKDAFIPNFTFEVDSGVTALDDIVADLYALVNVGSARLELAAIASDALDTDEGFVISTREQAARWLEDLQTRFQFDLPEVDGKVKAVKRNGSSVGTFTTDELRGHWDEETPPDMEALITDVDEQALPRIVEVGHMDYLLDYHNNVQQAMRLSGNSQDIQTVNLPMVLSVNNARQLAETILYQRFMEGRSFSVRSGPKGMWYHPGDVLTLQLSGATHTARLIEQKIQIMGPVEMELVRHAASVYTQSISGATGSGFESPVIQYPANTKLLIIDTVIIRPEDAGDGTQAVVYVVACVNGDGTYRGSFLHKEVPRGSGSYEFRLALDAEAYVGEVESGTASTIDRTVWDRDTSIVVNFLPAATLENVTEQQAMDNPELNLCAIGSMETGWYVAQFTSQTAGVAAEPYRARYTVSGFLWDRFASGAPPAGSLEGLNFVLLNSAVRPMRMELEDVGRERLYRVASSGQPLDQSPPAFGFTLEGNSLKPPAPVNLRGTRNSSQDLLIEWTRRERINAGLRDNAGTPLNEEAEIYQLEIYDGATRVHGPVRIRERSFGPVFWRTTHADEGLAVVADSDGSLAIFVVVPGDRAVAESAQRFGGEVFVEFVVETVRVPVMGFAESGAQPSAGVAIPMTHYLEGTDSVTVRIENTVNVTVADGDRIAFRVRGGVVDYFLNYTGETSIPVHRSAHPWDSSTLKKLVIDQTVAALTYRALAVRTLMPLASYLYTAEMQAANGFTPGDEVTVRVYQESAVVGVGRYAEKTL